MKHDRHEHGHHKGHSREGAKQPEVFNPARAALLDAQDRFEYLPPNDIAALLDAPDSGVVVDFGAGTGTFAIELARRRPDLKVIALDEQAGMLELLRAKPAVTQLGNIQPLLASEIDSIKGTADRVFAINVLHEVGDEALLEMSHLLKPQGTLLIIDWDGSRDRPIGPPKGHTHTPAEARARLEKAGLEVKTLESLPYHFVLLAHPRKNP
jgi:SAM-dependent methyltransferase